MSQILDRVLGAARQLGASDVHLKAGLPPIFRIKGDLRTVRDVPPLTREAIAQFAVHMMNDRQRAEFETNLDIDLAYGTPDGVRYRVNMFQQRGSVGMVMRLIPPEVPPFDRLNLPQTVLDLANNSRGVVLVTGATGSGKSTTLAACIDYINTQQALHIVTIEDPIEYTFRDKRSVLNQREIGFDTMSFARALRAALRQDPDVILVGEMRDFETAQIAMTAAETGHLVLSTLHTVDATETINRIISMFPTHQQQQARLTLASVLRGVVSQRLLPRADGKGMVPALEIMVNTERVREMIEDPVRTREIKDAIAEGLHPYGMISFDQSLASLVKQRLVTYEEAVKHSTSPSDFALLFRGVSGSAERAWAPSDKGASTNDEFEIEHFEKSWLALALALFVGMGAANAGGRKRVVVLDFDGPKAEKFHDDIVKMIKKSHTVIATDKWNGAAEELDASKVTEKNVKKVAKKLKIDGIITGKIEKRRDEYIVQLKLRAGSSGELVGNRIDTKADGPRIDGKAARDIKDELIGAIEDLEANHGGGGDDDDDAKPAKKKKASDDDGDDDKKHGAFSKKKTADDDDDDAKPAKKSAKKSDDDDAKPAKKGKKSDDDDDAKPAKKSAKKSDDDDDAKPAKKSAKKSDDDDDAKPAKKSAKKSDDDDALSTKIKTKKDDDDDSPKTKKRPKKSDDDADDEGGSHKKKVAKDDDDDSSGVEGHADEPAMSPDDALSPANRAVDFIIGMSFTARRLTFSSVAGLANQPPSYKQSLPVAGGIMDATVYPLAFTHKDKGPLTGLGIEVMYDKVIHINSSKKYIDATTMSQLTATLPTVEDRFAIGAVFRYPFGSAIVGGKLQYSSQQFTVGQALPNNMPTDIPNVAYSMVEPKLFLKYILNPKMILDVDAGFELITSTGNISKESTSGGYGPMTVSGYEAAAGLDYALTKNIFVRAEARVEVISMTFKGDPNSLANNRDNDNTTQDVSGAKDLYFGGFGTIGYIY